MNITLNGQPKELLNAPNLKIVIEKYCKNKTPVIAELNGTIIKDLHLEQTILKDGDTIELVNFVGGGSIYKIQK